MDMDQQQPCPHSQETEETGVLCDILQVAKLERLEEPWPDSGRRAREPGPSNQGPVTLGGRQYEVTSLSLVTLSPTQQGGDYS